MKKLTYGLLALVMMGTMSGCANATTQVTNPNEKLITVGKDSITRETLYSTLLSQGQITPVINLVTEKLIDLEVPLTDEITAEAQKNFDDLKAAIGDNFSKLIEQAGFTSEEAYFNDRVLYTVRAAKLTNVYLEENFAQAIATYKPMQVQILETTDAEKALTALNAIRDGQDFETIAKDTTTSTTFTGVTQVINSQMGIDTAAYAKIAGTKEAGLIDEVIQGGTKYYVVNVVDSNPENYKQAAIDSMAKITAAGDDAFQFFLTKYDFRIYDYDVYQAFQSQAPKFIVQD